VFIAASTHSFGDTEFYEACSQLVDLEYDKIEIWLDEESDHLKPSTVAADPERFHVQFRESTRLTPIAFCIDHDVSLDVLQGISRAAKSMRVTQITVPAAPLGTPFNTEIDRLRAYVEITSQDGIRVSIATSG